MSTADYEYAGLMAQAWDLLRGDTSTWPDRFFFLKVIERYGQPVLDVGCGTGRLLLDYLQQGIDIDGVDNSPEMLEICRRRAAPLGLTPALFEQHMESLDLPRAYSTILAPSSSLQLLIDAQAAAQAMQRLLAHLEPRGALVSPFMTVWQEGEPLEASSERTAVRPEDGAAIRRVEHTRFDPATGFEHTDNLYQVLVDGVVVREERHHRSPATRSYTQDQARDLFERNGLQKVQLYSGFSFEPAIARDRLFTVIGERG